MERLVKFIKDNDLTFSGAGSDLNGNCIILAGYADYLNIDDEETLIKAVRKVYPRKKGFSHELSNVFTFAKDNNYGDWWTGEAALKMYKF